MIKRNQVWLNRLNAFIDFLLIVFSYVFSSWFRLRVLTNDTLNMALTRRMMFAAVIYAAGLLLVLAMMGFYGTTRTRSTGWKLGVLILATTVSVLIASTLLFVFRLEEFSRGIILIFYFLTILLLGSKYVASRLLLDQLRVQGYNIKHEVVVGTGPLAKQYVEDVNGAPELGIEIDSILSPGDPRLEAKLAEPAIDEVVIALEAEEYRHITTMIAACEKNGVRYLVIPFYNNLIPSRPIIENVGRSKLINMRTNRLEDMGWAVMKRAFDLTVSALGLLILSPLLLLIAAGVKLSSPGPVLFKQVRVGYKRREFQMLKFRSMRVNDAQDTAWSMASDNRRTRFGSLIRKTSLDELPQLFNVLRGDMSLVGPRPELPHFVEQFKEEIPFYMVKHQVKPGITGWAQVNGYRGDTSISKRIELDLWYIDNWSPWLDLRIMLMTFTGGMLNNERLGAADESDLKIAVAAPEGGWLPKDPLYVMVPSVAAEGDFAPNDASRCAAYGELTTLYWAWKHLSGDYLGFMPKNRLLTLRRFVHQRKYALTLDQARLLVAGTEVLLPRRRKSRLDTGYGQFARSHDAEALNALRRLISDRHPEYLNAFDQSMRRGAGHRMNLFIMRRDLLDQYCQWLFCLLGELEDQGASGNSAALDALAELLLDVWLDTRGVRYRELPCIDLERQSWIARSAGFIKRRLENRYEEE